MSLQEYARPPQQRKASVQPPGLVLVGVAVSQAKHHACIGPQTGIPCRKLAFPHSREGFRRFAQPLRAHLVKNSGRRLLIALEPAGISWQGLYDRRRSCGYAVCRVSCQAVHNNRQPMQEATSNTEAKEAYSVLDLLRQGKLLLPVERDAALQAADRLLPRPMAVKKRLSQLRNPLRAALHLTFPEVNPLLKALTHPTS